MPATAGRVRMPANNRVHSSAALQTHGIWQSAIGYDPYAPNKEDKKDTSHMVSNAEPDAENAYANFQGLLALAKISNSNVDVDRGSCKKCGRVGHLKFQCKNYVKVKDDNEKDPEAMQVPALVALEKLKGRAAKVERRSTVETSDESDEEDDSDSSDSEVDSEIERIIAERAGKKISGKGNSSRKKDSDDGSDTRLGKKRGRSKKRHGKREISDSDDSVERRMKRRREQRRKRDKSPDDNHDRRHSRRKSRKEKRRRRSRRSESDSETSEDLGRRHRRKTRKAESSSDTESSGLDSRVGRDVKKSGKTRRRHHKHDE